MAINKPKWLFLMLFLVAAFGFGTKIFPNITSGVKGLAIQPVVLPEGQGIVSSAQLKEDKKLVELRDQSRNLLLSFPVEKLQLDKYFPVQEEDKKGDSIHSDFFIRDGNNFIFSISRSIYCGANNCTWGIYVYQLTSKMDILAKNIFGNIQQILLSPDKRKIAVLSYTHGGYCSNGSYLYLLDRAGKKTIKVNSLNLKNYSQSQVEDLSWEGDTGIRVKVLNSNCSGQERNGVNREVKCRVIFDSDKADCTNNALMER